MVFSYHLSKEDRKRIAMALMVYKKSLDLEPGNDLYEYNKIEIANTDELARFFNINEGDDFYEYNFEPKKYKVILIIETNNDDENVKNLEFVFGKVHNTFQINQTHAKIKSVEVEVI
jgi:hypothetical protein